LKGTNDWLRQRQGVALPILPPSTREAREYFFKKNRGLATVAAHDGRRTVDYAAFAREWNRSADGKTRHYVTTSEVLTYYAKSWQKHNNSRASQELISKQLEVVASTREVFAASHLPLPSFLTGVAESVQPSRGLWEIPDSGTVPHSLSTSLATSRPRDLFDRTPDSFASMSNSLDIYPEPSSSLSGRNLVLDSDPGTTSRNL
jgi:hypothetical protein